MEKQDLILETCLLAGRIMMENGSEVYRVEDTMNRIAANAGEPNSISYVTATGLFMGLRKSHYAQVEDVHDRTINLEKSWQSISCPANLPLRKFLWKNCIRLCRW